MFKRFKAECGSTSRRGGIKLQQIIAARLTSDSTLPSGDIGCHGIVSLRRRDGLGAVVAGLRAENLDQRASGILSSSSATSSMSARH